MSATTNLALPLIAAAQAQKHVTHNEALLAIDALLGCAVKDKDLGVPPSSPADGDRYIVAAAPTGAWAGKAASIVAWQDGIWRFYGPKPGLIAFVVDELQLYHYNGTAWAPGVLAITNLQNLTLLGLGATADATNPFSTKLNAALHTAKTVAEGGTGSVQVKLSKESAAKTASYLFQDNFAGRAELGLIGDDNFTLKVSADGAAFNTGLSVDKGTGNVGLAGYTADATNGLGVKATNILFDKKVDHIRALLNKAAAGNDASVGFQTGFSTRALLGLLGDDNLTIKVSPDGSTFKAAVTIDKTTGATRLPYFKPRGLFHVKRGTDQGGLAAGAFNQLQFDTKDLDADSWFDTGTYRFTPQEPGWYFVYADAQITYLTASSQSPAVALRKNGTIVDQGGPMVVLNTTSITLGAAYAGALMQLNGSTDYVDFAVYCGTGSGTSSTSGAGVRNFAGGFKVSDF